MSQAGVGKPGRAWRGGWGGGGLARRRSQVYPGGSLFWAGPGKGRLLALTSGSGEERCWTHSLAKHFAPTGQWESSSSFTHEAEIEFGGSVWVRPGCTGTGHLIWVIWGGKFFVASDGAGGLLGHPVRQDTGSGELPGVRRQVCVAWTHPHGLPKLSKLSRPHATFPLLQKSPPNRFLHLTPTSHHKITPVSATAGARILQHGAHSSATTVSPWARAPQGQH